MKSNILTALRSLAKVTIIGPEQWQQAKLISICRSTPWSIIHYSFQTTDGTIYQATTRRHLSATRCSIRTETKDNNAWGYLYVLDTDGKETRLRITRIS